MMNKNFYFLLTIFFALILINILSFITIKIVTIKIFTQLNTKILKKD